MALTAQEVQDRIARDLLPKYAREVTWGQIVAAFGALDTAGKADFVQVVRTHRPARIGSAFARVVSQHLQGLADTEAAAIFADNQVSLTEMDRWIG